MRTFPASGDAPCAALKDARWRGECYFTAAEARAKAGDRWAALQGCGRAGAFYNECLYHAWSFELQRVSENLGRAVNGVEAARPIVEFWSGLETIGPDAEAQIWRDWWYFAHTRNKPASLGWCTSLASEEDRARCEDGTRLFVRRTVVDTIIRQSTPAEQKDRLCRGSAAEALALLGELYVADPALDAELAAGLASGCAPGPTERPWNPVFRDRRLGQ